MLKASNNNYGAIAKAFRWVFALVIFWQLFTGLSLHNMGFSPEKVNLSGFTKLLEH